MVHIAKLVVALAGAAVVSAVPTPARRATVDVTPSGQQRSTAIKWWYKAGGIPDRNADSPAFRRRRGGRGGRGGSKGGKGGNGGGATTTSASQSETTSVAEDTTSSSDAAETTSSAAETTNGAETTSSEDAAETTTAESTTEEPSETSTTEAPQETEDPDQAIGDADTGLKDTIEVCREPDGKTLCFLILADTKNTCFLLPFPIAGDVEFFVPMPNATCTMFNNRDCDGDGVAGFGANDQKNMVAWSCQPKAAAITSTSAAPAETTTSAAAEETTSTEEPAETTTTDEAAETTTTDAAAETTTTDEAAETTTTDEVAETTTTDGAAETTTTDAPAETTTSEAPAETTTTAGNGNGNGQTGTGKGNNGKGNNGKGNNGKGNNGKGNVKPTKSQNGGPRNTSTGLSKPTKSTTKAGTTKTSTGLAKPTKSTTKTTSTRSTPVRPTAVRPTTKTTARPTNVKTTKTSSAQFTKPTKTKSNTKNNTKTTTRGGASTTSQPPASTTTPASSTSVELDNPIPTSGGGGAQLGGNDEGGANGLTDTNKTNTIRACKGNNVGGNLGDDCIEILSDVASTCFSFPGQFTGEIGAFLPMPGGFCTLFTDDNCSSQETTTGFGTIQNKSQKSWSCSNTPPADDNAGNNGGNNGNADNGNNGNDNANNGGNNGNNDNANNGGNDNANDGNNGADDNANNGNDNANNGGDNNADNGNADNGNNGNNGGNNDNSGALPEGNVSDFGTCTPPAISFGRNIKGRNPNELAFIATDTNAFPHDGALNIKVITDSMCLDLINRCGLKNGDAGVDACRRAEAAALQKPNDGSAADEFNRVIGTQTNFASVTRRSAKFRF